VLLARLLAGFAFLLVAGAPAAHELSMAELELRQVSREEFAWQWTASGRRPASQELRLEWPDGCGADGGAVRCGAQGLAGTMTVEGVGKRYSAVLLRIHWLDGQMRVHTMTASQPSVRLFGAADDPRGSGEIAWAYTVLGVEHILGGIDHLLFVLGLLFLVGFNRRLVATITAFTAAHSVTLALSALGLLTLRPAPVEATIALSIVLVAKEALERRDTLSSRWPALVAFLFGLVHGLGFAGALKAVGLPDRNLPTALLTFNIGVELGQLLVVGAAYGVHRVVVAWPPTARQRMRAAVLYAIGSLAAYWSIQRIVAIGA
jgi:hypothetical protein